MPVHYILNTSFPVLLHRHTTADKQVVLDRLGIYDTSWASVSDPNESAVGIHSMLLLNGLCLKKLAGSLLFRNCWNDSYIGSLEIFVPACEAKQLSLLR